MATIQNCADYHLSQITPRLIKVPSNGITLIGTGTTFQVRDNTVSPSTIIVTATPYGHIVNQTCIFTLTADRHTLDVPSPNVAVITGHSEGSDIITLLASINYQGVLYESTYTINKIDSNIFTVYELTTSSGSLTYDPNTDTYDPTSITINAVYTDNRTNYLPYNGKFSINVSYLGSSTWGSAVYTSAMNENTYTYNLTGVNSTSTAIRFRLHRADETISDSNVLDTTIIPVIVYGYGGSSPGGKDGKSVNLYIGSALPISIYTSGYLATASNTVNPIPVQAITGGFVGSQWYRWLLDEAVVSDWGTTNSSYTYYRKYDVTDMPDVLRVEVCDTYSGSNVSARDYITFISAESTGTGIVAHISNEFHTIPFDTDGIGDYSDSGVNFWVLEGATLLTLKGESNLYHGSAGAYNLERTYTDISSGGSIGYIGSTTGIVPDHTSLLGLRANVTYTFRVTKTDYSAEPEINKVQVITKSSTENDTIVIGSNDPIFFTASNLPNLVDFTDLKQTFWPGDNYSSPIYSGSVGFGYVFSGMTGSTTSLSNSYIGSLIYGTLEGIPSNPLTIAYTGSVGVACDPMDHPVLFGIKP